MAPDWLNKREQAIGGQISSLTQLLTMTRTHKFPTQDCYQLRIDQTIFYDFESGNEIFFSPYDY